LRLVLDGNHLGDYRFGLSLNSTLTYLSPPIRPTKEGHNQQSLELTLNYSVPEEKAHQLESWFDSLDKK